MEPRLKFKPQDFKAEGPVLTFAGPMTPGTGHYCRPENPNEVTVYLYTKDGRQWRAEWGTEKPIGDGNLR